MIVGLDLNLSDSRMTLQEILKFLECSPKTFHLTGSRFFGNYTEHSDYDFFTQSNNDYIEFLLKIGFRKLTDVDFNEQTYDGKQFVTILEYLPLDGNKIQIQFVYEYDRKNRIQNRIKNEFKSFNDLTKEQKRDLWSFLL